MGYNVNPSTGAARKTGSSPRYKAPKRDNPNKRPVIPGTAVRLGAKYKPGTTASRKQSETVIRQEQARRNASRKAPTIGRRSGF